VLFKLLEIKMNYFLYTFYTWILSLLVLVVGLAGYDFYLFAAGQSFDFFFPEFIALIFFLMVASSPAFLMAWGVLSIIIMSAYSQVEKIGLWILAVILSIVINIICLLLVFAREEISREMLWMCWPAYLSAAVVITIRSKQFFSLIHKSKNDGNT